jgi:hypothetical protein
MNIRADSFLGRTWGALGRRGDHRVMAGMDIWRVYGGQPSPVTLATRRQARRLQRKYARLGIQSSLYSGDGKDWELRQRLDENGRKYALEGER